jgi:hypothetical protein
VWSCDPVSYAGGSFATRRVSHAGQVKGDGPDQGRYPGPPGWGLGERPTIPPCKTHTSFEPFTETSERMDDLEALSKGGQGSTSGCCAIEEEDYL